MSTKTIITWINGSAQSIQVPDLADTIHEPTLEERIETLESRMTTISSVSLPLSAWSGSESPYSQSVTISGTTANSRVDLQPTAAQVAALQDAETTLIAENNNGAITIYAIGTKPTVDYDIQVSITEINI